MSVSIPIDIQASIGKVMRQGFKLEPNTDNVVESQTASGKGIQRFLRSSFFTHKISASFRFTDRELAIFANWHAGALANGTKTFLSPFSLYTGMDATHARMVGGKYTTARSGRKWRVSMALYVRILPRITNSPIEALYSYDDLGDMLDALNRVNVEYPTDLGISALLHALPRESQLPNYGDQ